MRLDTTAYVNISEASIIIDQRGVTKHWLDKMKRGDHNTHCTQGQARRLWYHLYILRWRHFLLLLSNIRPRRKFSLLCQHTLIKNASVAPIKYEVKKKDFLATPSCSLVKEDPQTPLYTSSTSASPALKSQPMMLCVPAFKKCWPADFHAINIAPIFTTSLSKTLHPKGNEICELFEARFPVRFRASTFYDHHTHWDAAGTSVISQFA